MTDLRIEHYAYMSPRSIPAHVEHVEHVEHVPRRVVLALCMVLAILPACSAGTAHGAPCVPVRAVDYRAGAWWDSAGRVVMHADAEDSYAWCAS